MSDEDADAEEAEEEPAVELGEGPDVEGAPLARVASRLTWPKEASRVVELEGDAVIRTPEGPRDLAEVVEAADETYFESNRHFVAEVRDVVGTGPVQPVE
jgi:hypothetical protein